MININCLPEEIKTNIKEFTIGYREFICDEESTREDWIGDKRFKSGNYKRWYHSGNLRYDSNYRNGNLHGVQKTWGLNRNLIEIKQYHNGKIYGEHKKWYDSGQLKSLYTYQNGKKHGPYKEFFYNGKLKTKGHYYNDELHKTNKSWHKHGGISTITNYEKGVPNGIFKQFNSNGRVLCDYVFEDGNIINYDHFING